MKKQIQIAFPIILVLAFSMRASSADKRVEVSKDGRQTVVVEPSPTDGTCTTHRSGVPYPAAPDWSSTGLRRQVGALAAADLNGDGRVDVAVGCYISSSFPPYTDWENFIYYNTGNALEASPSWFSADERHTGDLLIGNVNADNYPDIVSINGGTAFSPSVIYYGGPTGPDNVPDWTSTPPMSVWSTAGALFDWDHDGDLDLVTTNQGISPNPYRPMYAYRNNAGNLETSPFWQSDEQSIQRGAAFGDYDHDGWEDMAVAKWVNFQSGIHRNLLGVLQTSPTWTTGSTDGDRGIAWADVNGDTWPDLALGTSPISLYTNNAGVLTPTWVSTTHTSNPEDFKFEDIDRDGDLDLAEIVFSSGRVYIYLNTNGVLSSTADWSWDDPAVGNSLTFGDINGDHWPDLIIGLSGDPCVRVFYARIPVIPGDMNCDGRVDQLDVDAFVLALLDPAAYTAAYPYCSLSRGDFDSNMLVDGADTQPFIGVLLGP